MKKLVRRGLALLLAAMLVLGCGVTALAEDTASTATVAYDVNYHQTEARSILRLVNQFRTGQDAWYWNETNTEKVTVSGLGELTWDYGLEKAAMQRAAELALAVSHTRPDGTKCFTVSTYVNGENLTWGYSTRDTAQQALNAWLETNQTYSGQGHRRNMLGVEVKFTTIGVACVEVNGAYYWAMELGTRSSNTPVFAANDSETAVTADVSTAMLEGNTADSVTADPSAITLNIGASAALPTLSAELTFKNRFIGAPDVSVTSDWTVTDSSVAKIENGKLIGLKAGTTTIIAKVLGKTVSVNVTVNGASLETGSISVAPDSYTYTGKAITPEKVTVTVNGTTLTEGRDYTLSYANNTAVGTATVTATGKGSYTGTLSGTFSITECTHTWDAGKITKEATCTEAGEKIYTCSNCGETKTESIKKLGHDYKETSRTDATCTQDGSIVYTCTRCQDENLAGLQALGHSWGEWTDVTSPTCENKGSQKRVCKTCGAEETKDLDAAGHSWAADYTVDKEATCMTDGSQSIHCTKCDATKDSQVISAKGHSWNEGEVTKEATCTEEGEKTYTCSNCGETKTESIKKLGHDYKETSRTDATCTQDGSIVYTCTRCQDESLAGLQALGHSWGEWTDVTSPTCENKGSQKRVCKTCGAEETKDLDAAGHSWAADYTVDKEATCTTDGSQSIHCTKCDATKDSQVISAKGHSWNEGEVTKEATCTEAGEKTYTCSNCGEKKTESIKAQGHVYDGSWVSDEDSHWKLCKNCVAADDGTGSTLGAHAFVWVTDKEATASEAGSKHQECSVCGYKLSAVEIPATGTTTDPGDKGNTGDSGSTGDKGNTGDSGSVGDKGNTGDSGSTGNTGNTGSTGNTVNTGSKGNTVNSDKKGAAVNNGKAAKSDTKAPASAGRLSPKTDDAAAPAPYVIGMSMTALALAALAVCAKRKKA